MKEGWSYKKLGEVIDNLRTGLNPRVHFKLNTDDATGYYITVRELKGFEFRVDAKTDRINEQAIRRINERSNLKIGDVLYSGTGTIGRTAVVNELPTWWNIKEGVYAITLNSTKLNPYYFVYATHSDSFKKRVLARTSGTTVRSIPMKELKEIPLLVPPLSEQHSIVTRLDAAFSHIDALKANAEKQLNEARKLFQAELTECMKPKEGWEERKLAEVCEVISGQSPEAKYYNTDGQGTPFYQGKKEFSFKYIGEPTMWTTAETKIATKGDLLMSVRAPVGDVNFATQRLCIGRGLAAIRTKEEIDKEYLFYYLVGKKSCIKGKEGVGFASINRKEIMDIGIQYPEDLSAQHSIVSHLDSLSSTIRKLEELQQKTLAECDALKQAMLREVFE